jgi:hypothetical protein
VLETEAIMEPASFRVIGSKAALHDLRQSLLGEPHGSQFQISEPVPLSGSAPAAGPTRQGQLFELVIHFAVAVAAHEVHHQARQWIGNWLTNKEKQGHIQVTEAGPEASPTSDQE